MWNIIGAIWELLLPLPVPWRFVLIAGGGTIVCYQLIRRLLPLVLWPEFLITNRLRRFGLKPLPGTHSFGDFIIWTLNNLRRLARAALLLIGLGTLLWYVRPSVADTAFAQYIDQGIGWWYSLEEEILLDRGVYSPSHQAEPATSGEDDSIESTQSPEQTDAESSHPAANATATSVHTTYTVKEGDTLYGIARQFNVTTDAIVEANKSKYPSLSSNERLLTVGWALQIPAK